MTRAARIRNRIERQNGYDADEDEDDADVPKDFLEGWSSTMAQHAEEEEGAATAEAPGLFRRRLAGLVVINGAMVGRMDGGEATKNDDGIMRKNPGTYFSRTSRC